MAERASHLGQQIGHYRLVQVLGKGGFWEAATGNLVYRQTTYVIFGAAWSPDNTRIVTAGYNKVAQVWKIQ